MVEPEKLTPASRPITFCTLSVAVSPVSTSLAPANILKVKDAASSTAWVSEAATNGLSLTAFTLSDAVALLTNPSESCTSKLKVTSPFQSGVGVNVHVALPLSTKVPLPVVRDTAEMLMLSPSPSPSIFTSSLLASNCA